MVLGDKLYVAPIVEENIHKVLDIGTGTGICECISSKVSFEWDALTSDRGN